MIIMIMRMMTGRIMTMIMTMTMTMTMTIIMMIMMTNVEMRVMMLGR